MEHDPTKKIPDGEQIELFTEEQNSQQEPMSTKNDEKVTKEEIDALYAPDPDDFLRGQR